MLNRADESLNKRAAILIGPAGSGKTTVARGLSADGVCVIETGNLLEREVRADTEMGRQIRPFKTAGELVPSELVKRVISAELERTSSQFILFDGFPRSLDQVTMLDQILSENSLELAVIIEIKADLEKSIRRLSGRRICSKCGTLFNLYSTIPASVPKVEGICNICGGALVKRGDDEESLIRRRFETFQRETVPVIDYLRQKYPQKVCDEDAEAPLLEVQDRIRSRLAGSQT